MTNNLPAPLNPDRALVAEIAMDVGKSAASHLRIMYPDAFAALGKSGQLSLRNHIRNEIMSAIETIDADAIRDRLEQRRKHRRDLHRTYDRIRRADDRGDLDETEDTAP